MADPKAHQLYKQIGYTLTVFNSSAGESTTVGPGWEILTGPSGQTVTAFRNYIDLAGWTKQALTTFTQGVDIQKSRMPQITPAAPAPGPGVNYLIEIDLLTTRRMTDFELGDTDNPAGFHSSTADLMEVIYGTRTTYASNTQILGSVIKLDVESWGSGNPTATDKLHWSRVYVMGNAVSGDLLIIYPANLVVQAMTVEEKDLVWMERLRRSYVLQGEI